MKQYFTFVAILGLVSQAVFAIPSKSVHVPFTNQLINSINYDNPELGHAGLSAKYNLNTQPNQKIVCVLTGLKSGYVRYRNNGKEVTSSDYSGTQSLILTHTADTGFIADNWDQFHVDADGYFVIRNSIDTVRDDPKTATASCFYALDKK